MVNTLSSLPNAKVIFIIILGNTCYECLKNRVSDKFRGMSVKYAADTFLLIFLLLEMSKWKVLRSVAHFLDASFKHVLPVSTCEKRQYGLE